MKKIISILLCTSIILSCLTLFAGAVQEKTAYAGKGVDSVILISENASEQENYAAKVLQENIFEITGVKTVISTSSDKTAIKLTRRDITADRPDGSYEIEAAGSVLTITGYGNRGTIYGVYGFLEKYCGIRRYTKDVKVSPKSDTICVNDGEKYVYTPYFECTDTDWSSPRDPDYSLENGLNSGIYRTLSNEQGGTVNYISNFCHTLTSQFCSKDKYFEEHPEFFALRDGKRIPDQLCLTNPDVIKIVTDEVLELIKQRYDPSQAVQIVSLTQADNQNYCTCDKCAALDKENGSQAGTMITFANTVARAVKGAGYDNIAIDTFAYQYTRKTPTKVVPDDNVIVRICSIECCFGHTLDDTECRQNTEFMNDLVNWGKICKRIYIWDYANNYSYTVNIFPDFAVLQRNMQIFSENNAKGMYVEGNYYINECDAEFGELRAYLISKLIQNPYLDYEAEMNGFLNAFYGEGGKYIKEFIDITSKRAATGLNHLNIAQKPVKTLPGITAKEIKKCDELWEKAKAAAADETQLKRIERSELCWRFWKCENRKSEFSLLKLPTDRMAAQEELYNDYHSFGIIRFGEYAHRDLSDCPTLYMLRKPTKWVTLYDEKIWDTLAPFVVKFYNFFSKLF